MIKISVIIPVYNSEHGLVDTIQSIIQQQEFNLDELQLIVVDNNSSDKTFHKSFEFKSKFKNFMVLSQTKQGSYAARNLGIEHASGELLCFIDADVELEHLFFRKVVEEYKSRPFDYAGVNVQIKRLSKTLASDYDALKAFHVEEKMSKGNYTPTITALVRKEVVNTINGFDDRMESGGDVVFGKLVYNNGFIQRYLSDVFVTHPARDKISLLIKKAKRVARGYAYHTYYYEQMFDHNNNFFKKINFYLPNNPFALMKISKERGLNISIMRCIIASFLAIPLSIITRNEYYTELKKLSIKNLNG